MCRSKNHQNENYKRTVEEFYNFSRKNRKAMQFNMHSASDYISARVCFLNGVLSGGYISSQQAIEKQIKSIILLCDPEHNVKGYNYDLGKLVIALEKLNGWWNLDRFRSFTEKLNNSYELERYPGSKLWKSGKIKTWTLSSSDINQLDEMYFHLCLNAPIPETIKYRTGILSFVSDRKLTTHNPYKWAILNNKSFSKHEAEIMLKAREI